MEWQRTGVLYPGHADRPLAIWIEAANPDSFRQDSNWNTIIDLPNLAIYEWDRHGGDPLYRFVIFWKEVT